LRRPSRRPRSAPREASRQIESRDLDLRAEVDDQGRLLELVRRQVLGAPLLNLNRSAHSIEAALNGRPLPFAVTILGEPSAGA
jgi:hypothetical protein